MRFARSCLVAGVIIAATVPLILDVAPAAAPARRTSRSSLMTPWGAFQWVPLRTRTAAWSFRGALLVMR